MTMTNTPASAPVGSYAASVVYSRTLMARMIQQRTFLSTLSGPVPMDQWMQGIQSAQTESGYPVIQVQDLAKVAGDQVTVDILDRVGGKPIMGDRIAKNSGTPISILRDSVFINQSRKVIDVGGRMTQQRTPHQLRMHGQGLAIDYIRDLQDNVLQVQMAGARGFAGADGNNLVWKVPVATDGDFADIMVNAVTPPTNNRYYGLTGSITNPTQVTTTNVLTLNFFDDLRTRVDTSPVPLQGVKIPGPDGKNYEGELSPLLVCFISTEQWNQLMKETSAQNWRTFLSNATERLAWTKHPLFRNGQCGLWRDILICQTPRSIEFLGSSIAGYQTGYDSISYYDTAGALQTGTIPATTRIHRGVLLGAQALAAAYGNADRWSGSDAGTRGGGKTDVMNLPYSWVEKLEDGDNLLQLFIGVMFGIKKLKYTFGNQVYDNGVVCFDSHVPLLG